MCPVLTDREGGQRVPCADRDGIGQHVCSQPWSHIDEEIEPLGQFNTCCLHSVPCLLTPANPSSLPKQIIFSPFYFQLHRNVLGH